MSAGDDAMDNPDPERRKLLAQATAAAGGVALAGASLPFAVSLWPSERSRAQGAPVEAFLADEATLRAMVAVKCGAEFDPARSDTIAARDRDYA